MAILSKDLSLLASPIRIEHDRGRGTQPHSENGALPEQDASITSPCISTVHTMAYAFLARS